MRFGRVVILTASVVIVASVSEAGCLGLIDEVSNEIEADGGTEYETLDKLHLTCLAELKEGNISADAEVALSEVGSYLDSWDALKLMLVSPPESMKTELIENRPDIAASLERDLEQLRSEL